MKDNKEKTRGKRPKELDGVITVKMTMEEIKRIDEYAKRMKVSRSQLVRNLVKTGLDDLQLMRSTGLLSLAIKGYDVFELFRNGMKNQKLVIEDEKLIIEL